MRARSRVKDWRNLRSTLSNVFTLLSLLSLDRLQELMEKAEFKFQFQQMTRDVCQSVEQ